VAYCDLDNFKPFNDTYGYARGDDVIRSVGQMLQEEAGPDDLVGHVGGDDFILVMRSPDWQARCLRMMDRFEASVAAFYDPQHRELGGIRATNRLGEHLFQPFLSISIGVAMAHPGQHSSHMEIATVAAEVKHQAKQRKGHCLFVDRRNVDQGMGCVCPARQAGDQMVTSNPSTCFI
jgi:diguanylate cyclase (GGDEF)-like protein